MCPAPGQALSFRQFTNALSPARVAGYRTAIGEAPRAIVARYRWNLALCAASLPALNYLEVALRNNLHRSLSSHFATTNWYDTPHASFLEAGAIDAVATAKAQLSRDGKTVDPDRIVAELSFGFWTGLFGRAYEGRIWPALLRSVLPHMPRPLRLRKRAASRFHDLRHLRNRISHHEPIWKYPDLGGRYDAIVETIEWLEPELKLLLSEDFGQILRAGPAAYEVPVEHPVV